MGRTAIETLLHMMDVAYRADPFSALRRNVESVRPDEWHIRPAKWATDEFGTWPELSICDVVLHVAGAKHMYASCAFADAPISMDDLKPPALDMPAVLSWLDDGHRRLVDGLAALGDDIELMEERPAPWGQAYKMQRQLLITMMISHDLYHSGEVNRQRALIRGAEGWDRDAPPRDHGA
jgi:hypothetical protein